MSNSSLVDYVHLSPNCDTPRQGKIKKITIHHVAGNVTLKQLGNSFANPEREGSSNYGIDSNGRIGMFVEEANRAWTSSSEDNDNQAVTIEVANDGGAPDWHVSDKALASLIDLCVDICKRNGIKKLNFTGDITGNLTMHKYFVATTCPGPYLESKFPYIADEVNKRLKSNKKVNKKEEDDMYKVQVGAFEKKENAEALLKKLKAAGFNGFIVSDNNDTSESVNISTAAPTESYDEMITRLAKEVWAGKHGTGDVRRKALGQHWDAVHDKIKELYY